MTDTRVEVLRARLRSKHALASAHGIQSRLEDALRVSTKPAALAHRFVLVRAMHLKFPEAASAQTIALALEREWQEIAARAQPMALAGAQADVVWADDLTAAHCVLIQRWLQGGDDSAWFWKRLAPDPMPADWPLRVLALIIDPGEDIEPVEAGDRVLRILRTIARNGALMTFIIRMEPGECEFVMQMLKPCVAVRAALAPRPEAPEPMPVDTQHAEATAPAGAGPDEFFRSRDRLLAVCREMKLLADAGVAAGANVQADAARVDSQDQARADRDAGVKHEVSGGAAARSPESGVPQHASPTRVAEAPPEGSPHAVLAPESGAASLQAAGAPSAWAGLFFILPPLLRAGFDDIAQPATVFAHVLARVLTRWCVQDAMHETAGDPTLRWAQGFIRCHAPGFDRAVEESSAAWLRRLRRYCIHDARVPLRNVLHRRGQFWSAAHHIDVVLPLQLADVRLRRAGFDLDPGYVPWLEAVVHFHYSHDDTGRLPS
jgi:hypothetical protein